MHFDVQYVLRTLFCRTPVGKNANLHPPDVGTQQFVNHISELEKEVTDASISKEHIDIIRYLKVFSPEYIDVSSTVIGVGITR